MKVFGITGWKNSGKTGLMERLVAHISRRGFTVSTIKHAHHTFDIDQPGKDSYRHRSAGASQVLLASQNRWALMSELRGADEPPLAKLLRALDPVDLVLVEGYKREAHFKIEAHRRATGKSLIASQDERIIAVASDGLRPGDLPDDRDVAVFDLDDTAAIAGFILEYVEL